MAASSLFEEGWRQGSLIHAPMIVRSYDLDPNDTLKAVDRSFDGWALATQDCDLHGTKCSNTTREFELRPLFPSWGEKVSGIRNRSALITDDLVLKADSPRLTLTAKALNSLKPFRDNSVSSERRREIKTWLGLRYDRPAVPEPFDVIAAEILYPTIFKAMPSALQGKIRDVLVYYDSESEIRLFVVMHAAQDRELCIGWLDDVSQQLAVDHGIAVVERHAEDASGTPLSVIETYYGLQSSELSLSAAT